MNGVISALFRAMGKNTAVTSSHIAQDHSNLLFGTILQTGQSYIGVLFHAMREVTTVYFWRIAQGYNNPLFSSTLHIGQSYIGVLFQQYIFGALRKVTTIRYLAVLCTLGKVT